MLCCGALNGPFQMALCYLFEIHLSKSQCSRSVF
jgi:hypothetical protein